MTGKHEYLVRGYQTRGHARVKTNKMYFKRAVKPVTRRNRLTSFERDPCESLLMLCYIFKLYTDTLFVSHNDNVSMFLDQRKSNLFGDSYIVLIHCIKISVCKKKEIS